MFSQQLGRTKGQIIYSVDTCLVRTNSQINSHARPINIADLRPKRAPKTASGESHQQLLLTKSHRNRRLLPTKATDDRFRRDHPQTITATRATKNAHSNERDSDRSHRQEHPRTLPETRATATVPINESTHEHYQQREQNQPFPATRAPMNSPSNKSNIERYQRREHPRPTLAPTIKADESHDDQKTTLAPTIEADAGHCDHNPC